MGFSTIPIEQALSDRARVELNNLLTRVPIIDEALDKGGWICGGYARQLMLDQPTREYFRGADDDDRRHPVGDVDVFFNSVQEATASVPKSARRSMAGFAKELHDFVKVQFIDDPDLIKPTIQDTLGSFDIVNCRVAINHRYIIVADDWREIESKRLLRIGRNDTPFLGGRLLKYLKYRGLEGITEDSYESLTGWLAHAGNNFSDGNWTTQHLIGVKDSVKKLRNRGLVRREDLIFFIGKWKEAIQERHYGRSFTYEVDWALNELETEPKEAA